MRPIRPFGPVPPVKTSLFTEAQRRELFPFVDDIIYLAAAAETPMPTTAEVALAEYHRDYARLGMDSFPATLGELDRCREAVARLLGGVDVDDVALVPHTSAGATSVAHSLPLWPGEVVLSNDREFPTNLWPFQDAAARAGAAVEILPTEDWATPAAAVERRLESGQKPRPQAVAWSWVQYRDGYRTNLGALGESCRYHGAFLAIDGIQGAGVVPLDLKKTPVDAFYAGGHKWMLGMGGGGFLYMNRERLRDLESFGRSWLSVLDPLKMTHDQPPREDVRRYESGNLAWGSFVALRVGIELILELGIHEVFHHCLHLQDHLLQKLEGSGVTAKSRREPREVRGPILALNVPGDPYLYTQELRVRGVVATARDGALRIAPHLYNTIDEMDHVAAAIRAVAP